MINTLNPYPSLRTAILLQTGPTRDGQQNVDVADQETEQLRKMIVQRGQESGDARTLAMGASVSLTGAMAARALNMVTQVLMARSLGAAQFGLYAIGWTLVRVLGTIGTLGLEAGIIYLGANYQRNSPSKFKGAVMQSIMIPFFFGTLMGAVVWFAAPTLAQYVFHKPDASSVIRAFIPAFPLFAVCFVAGGITRLSQRMQYSVYSSIGQAAFVLLLLSILLIFEWGLFGAIVATVSGFAVGSLISIWYVSRLFPTVFTREIQPQWVGAELLAYSASVMLAGVAYNTLMFVDRLFVASFRTSAETGIYQAASQLSILFGILLGAFHGMFRPMVADIYARGDKRRLAELYRVCSKWTLYSSVPVFLVILYAPGYLIELVYGRAYERAATPLLILSVGQIFMVVTAGSHTMLVMTGRQRTFVSISFATLVLALFLNLVLVPRFGLDGAATAAAVSNLFLNSAAVAAVRRDLGIWPVDIRCVKGLIAAFVTLGVLLVLGPLNTGAPSLRIFVVCAISLAVFTGCLGAIGLDPEDREFLSVLRRRLLISS